MTHDLEDRAACKRGLRVNALVKTAALAYDVHRGAQ